MAYVYIYMYIYTELIHIFKSVLGKFISLILSQVIPWIDLPTGTPFLKFTQEYAEGFDDISLKNPARERMVFLDFDISEFRHPRYLSASPLVIASPETPIREIQK
jgi:hypothetical protein